MPSDIQPNEIDPCRENRVKGKEMTKDKIEEQNPLLKNSTKP